MAGGHTRELEKWWRGRRWRRGEKPRPSSLVLGCVDLRIGGDAWDLKFEMASELQLERGGLV